MKVIHLISGGDTGGAKTHVLTLLEGLNRTITAELVCFREGEFAQEAREMGIPTTIFEGNRIGRTAEKLAEYIRAGGFQVIHCHGARGNMMGYLMRRATGLPVVTTMHSDYKLDYMGRPAGRLTYGNINAFVLRRFDYYIGVSDAMTDLLISRNFPPQQCYTIYNGIDFRTRKEGTDRIAYLRSLGAQVEEGDLVVGIAARLNPVKDVATLIRGFALAAGSCPRLRLVIAGDGEEREMLEKLAQELGVADKVCFAGWISGGMDQFYQSLDINTLTSLSETFPYALTEGVRYGLPTVSSRVGGVPYLIDHEVNGFLFPAGDAQALGRALIRLAEDEALRRRMGTLLREKAMAKFSLKKTIETQLSIYEDICRRAARPKERREGVLICGSYGKENAGDDAILHAIIREMRQIDPYMPITVLSRRPDQTRLIYRVDAIHTFHGMEWWRRMGKTRLYVSGGGSLIQDVTSRRSLWYYLSNMKTAKRRGNQVMMYGCGIGPVIREGHRKLSAKVMNRYVDAITLREPDSLQKLREMGVTRPEIHLSADPAVTMPPAPAELVDSAMLSNGVPTQGKYLCVALRNWPGFEEKLPMICRSAEWASRELGLTPVFLAVEKLQDPEVARRAAGMLSVPCYVIADPGAPAVIAGILSRMAAVVSMRLHALIFSAGQGVPLVGIVYDPKVSAFLKYIGQDNYMELEDVTEQRLTEAIRTAVSQPRDPVAVERLRQIEGVNVETAAKLYAKER